MINGQSGGTLTVVEPGSYTVRINNRLNCKPEDTQSDEIKVTVSTKPVAGFTFNAGDQCAGSEIKFTSTSTGEDLKYSWNFGDQASGANNTSTDESPSHAYRGFIGTSQKYTVTLKVTNEAGCEAVITKEVVVSEGPDATLEEIDVPPGNTPFANCSTNPDNIAYTLKVENKSTTPELNKSYAIDWGDGTKIDLGSTFENATHVYAERGMYKLVFTITGNNGCESKTSYKVYNGSKPSLAIGNPGHTMGCAPQVYTFPISSIEDNSPGTRYIFQFDDGTDPHIYTQENLPATISHTFTTASCDRPNGSFTLTGRAENPCGETTVVVSSIKIAAKPTVDFSTPTDSVCLGQVVPLLNETINGSTITNTGQCDRSSTFHWDVQPATGWAFYPGSTATTEEPKLVFSIPGSYKVTLSATNSCGTDVITKDVYVIFPPVAAFTIGEAETCNNLVAVTNASTGDKLSYTWSVSPNSGFTFASGTLNSKNPVFDFAETGDYTITLVTSNPCSTATATQQVKIMKKPLVQLPENKGYCSPQTIKFDASNALHTPVFRSNNSPISAYTWTISGGAAFVNGTTANSQNPEISFPSNGTYTVTAQATNGCGESEIATQVITIAPPVTNNIISSDQTICGNTAPATLTGPVPSGGSGSFTYTWEYSTTDGTSGFQAVTDATDREFTPTALTQNTWFRRIANSNGCEEISNAVKITVNPAPDAPIVAGTAICTGSATQLTVENPNGTYEWFSDDTGTTRIHTGSTFPTAALQTTTTYYVHTKNALGCPSPLTAVTVTVEQQITNNTVSQDQLLCTGATPVELLGSVPEGGNGNYTYLWESSTTSSSAGFAPAQGNNKEQHYSPGDIGQTTWFRRVVTAGVCQQSTSAPVQISVAVPISNNQISTPQAVCEGTQPATLKGTTPTGGNASLTILWESSTTGPNGTFAPAAGINNQSDYTPGHLTQTTWFRRALYAGGCSNVSAAIQISVVKPLSNNTISSDQLICVGTVPAPLQGTTPKGGSGTYTFLWEISTDNVAFVPAPGTNNQEHYNPKLLSKDTWFRRTVSGGTCAELQSNVVKVAVMAPVTYNNIGTAQRICAQTAPLKLNGSLPNGGNGSFTYLWEWSAVSATDGFTPAPGVNNDVHYQPEKLTRNTWFRRKVILPPCQENISPAVLVTVDPLPEAPDVAGGITCPGGNVVMKASSPIAGYVIEWYDQEQGGVVLHKGTTYTTEPLLTTTDYYIQTTNQYGCASERVKATAVVVEPSANAGPDITMMQGRSTQLLAYGGETYSWSPVAGLSDPNVHNPVANPQETTTYTVTVTTKEGCVFTDEVTITVLPQIEIANAITLNGDGINDTWYIGNIQHYPNCRVQIFNRWGALVFESKGYQTPWNGTNQGQPLPMSAYYYIIDLGVAEEPLAGSITLIK
ncbi:gliding motility-associated C-terminal domain-containing protein [Botryobacter ruber]|uniref:gliding motility-associated C-terminal domain-containing protein n=1 Tax=Botryobacter ruber TaxID=2171629 RepID=UPI0013E3E590|nr:gliding motility-associated C-terminal domain-containing protein [Botryobacter ruber]